MTRCRGAVLAFVVLAQLGGGLRGPFPTTTPTTPSETVLPPLRSPGARPPLPSSAPAVPPVPVPTPSSEFVWVPSRIVPLPGEAGGLIVPGHWEQRISDRETYMPPLTATTPDGRILQLPGGVVRSPEERQTP